MRQYIRHLVDLPLAMSLPPGEPLGGCQGHDLGLGGLGFRCATAMAPGQAVEIGIDCVQPPFHAQGRVVWCRPHLAGGHEVGVRFENSEEAFRARMVAQVCAIEDYRCQVRREQGRQLDLEQAAAEWVQRFAADFPGGEGSVTGHPPPS